MHYHYGFLLIKVAIVDAKYEIYVQNWSRYNLGGVDEVIHTHMDASSSLLWACVYFRTIVLFNAYFESL